MQQNTRALAIGDPIWELDQVLRAVEFRFKGNLAPGAQSVRLSPSFTQWDGGTHKMRKGPDGDWTVVLMLPPGVYHISSASTACGGMIRPIMVEHRRLGVGTIRVPLRRLREKATDVGFVFEWSAGPSFAYTGVFRLPVAQRTKKAETRAHQQFEGPHIRSPILNSAAAEKTD